MPTNTAVIDVVIHNGGSIFMFELRTEAAREWVDENVALESWQWMGQSFAVEHRYALDLAEGMIAGGLEVR